MPAASVWVIPAGLGFAQFPPEMCKKAGGDNDRVDHSQNRDPWHAGRLRQMLSKVADIAIITPRGRVQHPVGMTRT